MDRSTMLDAAGGRAAVFPGDGPMAARCRALDWAATPLGAVDGWPASLRTTVGVVLAARHPMLLMWGPELVQIYNDEFAPSLGVGGRAAHALGASGRAFWTDVWDVVGPQIERVMATGESTRQDDVLLPIERNGRLEDVWWTYGYSPVRGDDGGVAATLVVCQETTERVQLERELAAERAQLREIVDRAPACIAVLRGPEHRFERANAWYARLIGGRPHLGRTVAEVLPEVVDQGFVALLDRVLATGEPFVGRAVPVELAQGPDGAAERRYLDFVYQALTEADGTRSGVFVHGVDVTEAVLAREALESRAQELRTMILQTPAPLALLVGPEHRFDVVNGAFKQVSGGGRDVTGLTPPEAFPELVGSGLFDLFDRVYETGEAWGGPESLVRYDRDGTGIQDTWFNLRFEPVRDADGRVTAILNFAVDVTEQVRARRDIERVLAESERARADAEAARARSEAVLASIADAFYLLDRDWRFTYVNDAAERLLQATRDALVGRTLWDAFPGVAGSPFEGPYREAMATGRVTSAEAFFEPLDTHFDVRSYPWSGGLMVHFRDVTARKAAESERERLLAEAEAANRAKSDFLAVMSHELRTPLNAIGGYAELMELGIHGPVSAEQRQSLARIQQSQRHLLGLINQVLNYTRIDAGAVKYDIAVVPVAEALAAAEALVLPQVRTRGLTYAAGACPPGLAVRADHEKLQQALLNLLSNAIKFTDAGGEVRVTCAADEAVARIAVADTGVGITADKLARIFEPFVQVDQRHTRANEGVGLGLAISRDLVRGMGGDLAVESAPGAGSTFTLTLPRA